jgi:hypothetical protein
MAEKNKATSDSQAVNSFSHCNWITQRFHWLPGCHILRYALRKKKQLNTGCVLRDLRTMRAPVMLLKMTQPDGSTPTDDFVARFFVPRLENWPIYSKFPLPCTFSDLFIFNYVLQPLRLIVRPGLDVPAFAARRLHSCHHARAPSGRRLNCEWEMSSKFCLNVDLHFTFTDLLHAVKLRHGTDGCTSPPKEGALRIFFRPKNQTALAGCEPANLGTKGQHVTLRPPKPRNLAYRYRSGETF